MDGRISNQRQVASLTRYTVTEGREKGLEIIDCNNGNLRFLLNVSKACDMMQLYHKGQNMSFVSKNGFTKRETPFMNRFEGGMIYTCGLDSVGGREGFEVHGSLHNIPAEILRAECGERGIVVEALVRDTELFGKNLTFKRRISSAVGGDSVTVEDILITDGFRDEDYCLLYHINVGYPMLDDGAKVVADVAECIPRTPRSAEHADTAFAMGEPVVGEEETCYFVKLQKPEVTLVNEKVGKKFTVSYSADTLPHFVQWRSMAAGDYALGLEPATTELDDRFCYRTVKAGEQVGFSLRLSVTE